MMTTTQHPWARWLGRFKPGARVRSGAPVTDFADYGTAFGLDLSLSASASASSPQPATSSPCAAAVEPVAGPSAQAPTTQR